MLLCARACGENASDRAETAMNFFIASLPYAHPKTGSERPLTHRLRLRKFPGPVQDFGAWTIEPHRIVPTRHDRQAVRDLAVTASELDGDRAIGLFPGGDVV